MGTDQTSHENVPDELIAYAAELMQRGEPLYKIEEQLVRQGLSEESASAVITQLAGLRSTAEEAEARKNMNQGAVWFLGGVVVTIATYALASGGGTYVVAWGAIIFGGIQFVRGYTKLQNY
jgi:hypothetical protein